MLDRPELHERPTSKFPATPLFLFAVAAFVVSLGSPVIVVLGDIPIPGITALYSTTAWLVGAMYHALTEGEPRHLRDLLIPLMGTLANATLLTSAVLGHKLHRRHAMPMLWLSCNGLAVALAMPWVLDSFRLSAYSKLYFGYWLWITTFALVAAGWVAVRWNQRRMSPVASSLHPD